MYTTYYLKKDEVKKFIFYRAAASRLKELLKEMDVDGKIFVKTEIEIPDWSGYDKTENNLALAEFNKLKYDYRDNHLELFEDKSKLKTFIVTEEIDTDLIKLVDDLRSSGNLRLVYEVYLECNDYYEKAKKVVEANLDNYTTFLTIKPEFKEVWDTVCDKFKKETGYLSDSEIAKTLPKVKSFKYVKKRKINIDDL